MVDAPNRPVPRFPPAQEDAARAAIRAHLLSFAPDAKGVASGARGGDILFHECARELGVETTILLPFAPEIFLRTSVRGIPGSNWEERFRRLWSRTPASRRIVLNLPEETASYITANRAILEHAQAAPSWRLLALWDGNLSGKAGGTDDMIAMTRSLGAPVDVISLEGIARRP